MAKKYYLGLDMGTGSLGWAATDKDYQLCRAHGKDLWGIRLFETAETAEERRQFRCNRRRLDRKNRRTALLQEIFAEEISRVDPGFFLRLKESRYLPEDKRNADGQMPVFPYTLFTDDNFTDKDYHRQYPTIYHLRKELCQTAEPKDVRLVYLALHHIIKHRGHFLFPSLEANDITDFSMTFQNFLSVIRDTELDITFECKEEVFVTVRGILEDKHCTKSDKARKLCTALNASAKREKELLKMVTGCKVKLGDIFGEEYAEMAQAKISFSEAAYEDYAEAVANELEEYFAVVEAAKALYDWSVLVNILNGERFISDAKVKSYEKHKTDLHFLKQLVKEELSKEVYRKVFVNTDGKSANYCAYIGMTKINGRKAVMEGKTYNFSESQ